MFGNQVNSGHERVVSITVSNASVCENGCCIHVRELRVVFSTVNKVLCSQIRVLTGSLVKFSVKSSVKHQAHQLLG